MMRLQNAAYNSIIQGQSAFFKQFERYGDGR